MGSLSQTTRTLGDGHNVLFPLHCSGSARHNLLPLVSTSTWYLEVVFCVPVMYLFFLYILQGLIGWVCIVDKARTDSVL